MSYVIRVRAWHCICMRKCFHPHCLRIFTSHSLELEWDGIDLLTELKK